MISQHGVVRLNFDAELKNVQTAEDLVRVLKEDQSDFEEFSLSFNFEELESKT
jgi:uncharacterized protein YeaO (DUF488 family)